MFHDKGDYLAFLKLLEQGRERVGMRILAYCLMPNHWHLVLRPRQAEDLSDFIRWVCATQVRRWRMQRHTDGEGHLYQGRFKSFPIQRNEHLLHVMRYVEANPLRANLVDRAERWPYSSVWQGKREVDSQVQLDDQWIKRPAGWLKLVNRPLSEEELERLRTSVVRERPYGSDRWVQLAVKRWKLESTIRNPGRPRKSKT